MGFSIRIAPGVRVRASSRGVRTSIGPRVARVHVGGGRTGISSGIGPASFYAPIGLAGRTRSTRGGSGGLPAQQGYTRAQWEKLLRVHALGQKLVNLTGRHEEDFPAVTKPAPPAPPAVDVEKMIRDAVTARMNGLSVFARKARKQAAVQGEAEARAGAQREVRRRQEVYAGLQRKIDASWHALVTNVPEAVLGQLASAYEDNSAPAAPLGVEGDEASVVVLVPPMDAIPEQMPGMTESGNYSIRRMTKRDRNQVYLFLASGVMLATVKEAFAVAPGISSVRVVAVRATGQSAYGERRGEVIGAALIRRPSTVGVRWTKVDPYTILEDIAEQNLMNVQESTLAMKALDLKDEPDLVDLVSSIDFDDLGSGSEQQTAWQ